LQCDGVKRTPRVAGQARTGGFTVHLDHGGQPHTLRLTEHGGASASASSSASATDSHAHTDPRGGPLRYELDGTQRSLIAVWCNDELHIVEQAAVFVFSEVSAWPDQGNTTDPSRALSPVAGTVAQVLVKPGDAITAGQNLLSIEAMKMEMWLSAQADGVVKAVHAQPGDQVQAKALLIDIELTPG
jgi:geranyl-CoA carboxylase alpha subunit